MGTAVGETFAGYAIEGVLGRGGMGTVYLARHPRLPRKVALKLLHRDVSEDADMRARFLRESSVVAGLDHPGIVAVLDQGVENGQPWLAMQYVHGTDASRPTPRIPAVERSVRIIGDVATALDHAHSRGVLHRDVKPANILLTAPEAASPERAVLTDFGIARQLSANASSTVTGSFAATLDYASPEQLSGGAVDARSDQYSLACTLFTLLTGEPPFTAADSAQVIAGHLIKPVPSIDRPGVPAELSRVVARGMAKDPAERYDSAGEFAAAATAAVRGSTVDGTAAGSEPDPGPPAAPADRGRRATPVPRTVVAAPDDNPWPAVLSLLVGMFLVTVTGSALPLAERALQSELHADSNSVHWLTTIHDLGWAVPLITAGWLGDRFGPKNIQMAALGVFCLAAITCGLSGTFWGLTAAYLVLCVASAHVMPQAMAVAIRIVPSGRRTMAMSVWTGVAMVSMLGGQFIDASLITDLSWRWIFLIAAPISLGTLVMTAVLVPSLPAQGGRAGVPGLALGGLSLTLFALGIDQWSVSDWGAISWELFLVPSLLLGAVFILRRPRPGADDLQAATRALLSDRDVALSMLAMTAMGAALASAAATMVMYLELAQHLSMRESTAMWLPATAAAVVAVPWCGILAVRLHPAAMSGIGFGSIFVATVLQLAAITSAPAVPTLTVAGALTGLGSVLSWTPLATIVAHRVPRGHVGTGAGLFILAGQTGILVGRSVTGALLSSRLAASTAPTGDVLQHTAREAARSAMLVPIAFALFGMLPVLLVSRGRTTPAATTVASHTPVR
ncbi:MDR family MFS transporter [Nocardia stercoris]|uniref:non-specific serine/threonine protein kinase n=1 Tax=Nocardia stercoris TaxID=2483361 RepID=A0A3M2LBY4_9NOCA|nr:MDR family MFS transporter [Nocardia stercoris]RMI35059.1 MFS transporter [Nocardia stercoris]